MATLAQSIVDGVRILRLAGILDQDGVEEIRAPLSSEIEQTEPIIIDLSGVSILLTPGIGLFLGAHRERQKAGRRLIIAGTTREVAEVFTTCRLDRVLTLIPNLTDAIAQSRKA